MEQKGITYPARDIGAWLSQADVTHISNEIAFSPDCPAPDPNQEAIRFCSDPRYIELLESAGTDVVELTGNHMQDWGSTAMNFTLDLYRQKGWKVFGGGANLSEARKPALIEHNGNKLAFLGCNPAGPESDYATETRPGSLPCDYEWMHQEVARLRPGLLAHRHLQYFSTTPSRRARRSATSGHDRRGRGAVSGSQAHHLQALAFERRAHPLGWATFFDHVVRQPVRPGGPGTCWGDHRPTSSMMVVISGPSYDGVLEDMPSASNDHRNGRPSSQLLPRAVGNARQVPVRVHDHRGTEAFLSSSCGSTVLPPTSQR
jgi:hypothetical protein